MGLTNVMNRICLNGRAVASSMHFFVLPKMFLIFLFKDFLSYVPAPEQRDEIRKSDVNVSESGVAVPKQLIVVVTRFGRPLLKRGRTFSYIRVRSQLAPGPAVWPPRRDFIKQLSNMWKPGEERGAGRRAEPAGCLIQLVGRGMDSKPFRTEGGKGTVTEGSHLPQGSRQGDSSR